MFTLQFQKDQKAWRTAREQYQKLLSAIRAGKPDEDLATLADDAGVFNQEIIDLRRLRDRATAPMMKERAAKFDKLTKELDSLTAKVEAAAKAMDLSKTSLERDGHECQLYDLVETRQRFQMALADAQVAAGCVAAAREAGVV